MLIVDVGLDLDLVSPGCDGVGAVMSGIFATRSRRGAVSICFSKQAQRSTMFVRTSVRWLSGVVWYDSNF